MISVRIGILLLSAALWAAPLPAAEPTDWTAHAHLRRQQISAKIADDGSRVELSVRLTLELSAAANAAKSANSANSAAPPSRVAVRLRWLAEGTTLAADPANPAGASWSALPGGNPGQYQLSLPSRPSTTLTVTLTGSCPLAKPADNAAKPSFRLGPVLLHPVLEREPDAAAEVCRFGLSVEAGSQWSLVSSGSLTHTTVDARASWAWRSERPLTGLTLLGAVGRVRVQRPAGPVLLTAYVSPDQAERAAGLLRAAEDYITDYQRLLGPFPWGRLDLLELAQPADWEAGPAWVALDPATVAAGEAALRPGMLDRAVVGQWLAHSVVESDSDGGWAAPLTAYCADYLQTAAGGPVAAERFRRALLARAAQADGDAPLIDPRSRGSAVARERGVMLAHRLVRQMGPKTFFAGLRSVLIETPSGRPVGWAELTAAWRRQAAESAGVAEIDRWIRPWLTQTGLPELTLSDVTVTEDATVSAEPTTPTFRVRGRLRQSNVVLPLAVPIVLTDGQGRRETRLVLTAEREVAFELRLSYRPMSVVADPNADVYRRLPP